MLRHAGTPALGGPTVLITLSFSRACGQPARDLNGRGLRHMHRRCGEEGGHDVRFLFECGGDTGDVRQHSTQGGRGGQVESWLFFRASRGSARKPAYNSDYRKPVPMSPRGETTRHRRCARCRPPGNPTRAHTEDTPASTRELPTRSRLQRRGTRSCCADRPWQRCGSSSPC